MSPHPGLPGLPARALADVLMILGPVFLLWFVNMAITGWLAGRRGWNDGLWTVVALFLGPIALLAVLVAPGSRERSPVPEVVLNPSRATYTPGWPRVDEPPPITIIQRVLGGMVGAAISGLGAGIVAASGDLQPIEGYVLIGVAAGNLSGYWLSGAVKDASRGMLVALGVGAGFLVLCVTGLLLGMANAVAAIQAGNAGLELIPLYLVAAAMFPLISVLFYPTVLAVTLPAAVIWAAVTQLVLHRGPGRATQPTGGTWWSHS